MTQIQTYCSKLHKYQILYIVEVHTQDKFSMAHKIAMFEYLWTHIFLWDLAVKNDFIFKKIGSFFIHKKYAKNMYMWALP